MERYWTRVGNTEVRIEVRNYDGVCDHCGQTRIKYLAHVRQHLADTLNRVYEGTLARDDDQVAELAAHLIDGNKVKKVAVGCVCVMKYLVDCGVDAGLAKRLQKRVNTITTLLKNIARVDACNTPERIAQTLKEHADILAAGRAVSAASAVYRDLPYHGWRSRLVDDPAFAQLPPEELQETAYRGGQWFEAARQLYADAVNDKATLDRKFKTKYFGLRFLFRPLDEKTLQAHFVAVRKRYQRSLDVYTQIGEYE